MNCNGWACSVDIQLCVSAVVQTRDAILKGAHPISVEYAVQFAGMQCQIQFNDHVDTKHKPGFIEYGFPLAIIIWQRLWLRLGVNVDDQLWLRLNPIPICLLAACWPIAGCV